MSTEVRRAGVADLDILTDLNKVVQTLHARLDPAFFKSAVDSIEVRTFFAARLEHPGSVVLIAEIDRRPVGYVWFEVQSRPDTALTLARRRVYLHHLSVNPDARRRGVASALLDGIERHARSEGVDGIALDTWATNLDAQHFFASRGFAVFNVSMGKTLAATR